MSFVTFFIILFNIHCFLASTVFVFLCHEIIIKATTFVIILHCILIVFTFTVKLVLFFRPISLVSSAFVFKWQKNENANKFQTGFVFISVQFCLYVLSAGSKDRFYRHFLVFFYHPFVRFKLKNNKWINWINYSLANILLSNFTFGLENLQIIGPNGLPYRSQVNSSIFLLLELGFFVSFHLFVFLKRAVIFVIYGHYGFVKALIRREWIRESSNMKLIKRDLPVLEQQSDYKRWWRWFVLWKIFAFHYR